MDGQHTTELTQPTQQPPKMVTKCFIPGKFGWLKPRDAVIIWDSADKIGLYLYDKAVPKYTGLVFSANVQDISNVMFNISSIAIHIADAVYFIHFGHNGTDTELILNTPSSPDEQADFTINAKSNFGTDSTFGVTFDTPGDKMHAWSSALEAAGVPVYKRSRQFGEFVYWFSLGRGAAIIGVSSLIIIALLILVKEY